MSVIERDDVLYEPVEIRVLGPLRVRRADGSIVQPSEWLTSQTADLVRLLALRVEEPVAVDILIDALWPKVDEKRGRASLRTAASRVRKVLGEDCVQRRLGGLVLTGAWVDAHAFRTLAHQARRHIMTGELAKAVATTREAEAVYLGEFRSHRDGADWGLRERDALAATYRTMIVDAAEAAAALSWWHDAVDLAERTLLVEPCSERAYRALMRANRGLGETALALKTYDRCRHILADDVGADPSPETHALYLELLADEPQSTEAVPFVGRAHEIELLRELAETSDASGEPMVICLVGAAGQGKTRLAEYALSTDRLMVRTISCASDPDPLRAVQDALVVGAAGRPAGTLAGKGLPDRITALVVDDVHLLAPAAIERLTAEIAAVRGPACIALVSRPDLDDSAAGPGLAALLGGRASRLSLPELEPEEIAELSSGVLRGEVSRQLTAEVAARAGGNPRAVISLVRDWAAAGRIAATSAGLVVLHSDVAGRPDLESRRVLTEAIDRLSPAALDVLHLVAVLARPVTPELLAPLAQEIRPGDGRADEQWLRATLGHLADLSLLTASDAGLAPRDPVFNDLILTWLRPSARRALHRRVAERAHIPWAERVEHWLLAGEPQLARAAAIHAAADAVEEQQYERARIHLRELCRTSEGSDVPASDRVQLYESWGDAAAMLGRTHEARAAFAAGASTARAHDLPDKKRLEAKSQLVADARPEALPQPAPTQPGEATSSAPIQPEPTQPQLIHPQPVHHQLIQSPLIQGQQPPLRRGGLPPVAYSGRSAGLDYLGQQLQQAVREADARGESAQQVLARVALVRDVGIPQRKFRSVRRWCRQALALTDDPELSAEVLASGWLAGSVLGDASAAEHGLGRAAAMLGASYLESGNRSLVALRCLVAHDLGRRAFGEVHTWATKRGVFDDPREYQWVAIRVAAERGDLAAATLAASAPTPSTASPVVTSLRDCASAVLAMELGRSDEARALLTGVLDLARETGSTLMVPEAAARLVMIDAYTDPRSARNRFEQFDESVGEDAWFPREKVLKLLARAAVRGADGRPDDAASAAAAAADEAERAGLIFLAALAHRHRAAHLAAAGKSYDARLATAAAARWRRSADTTDSSHQYSAGSVNSSSRGPRRVRV